MGRRRERIRARGRERERERIPLGELVTDLEANGLDPAGGELGLGGVEAVAVRRHHLHDHAINAALRHLPPHLRHLQSPFSLSLPLALLGLGRLPLAPGPVQKEIPWTAPYN